MTEPIEMQTLARKFIERAEALKMKGRRRDEAALDFFCGVAVAAEAAGDPVLAQQIGIAVAMSISVRGHIAVAAIAHSCQRRAPRDAALDVRDGRGRADRYLARLRPSRRARLPLDDERPPAPHPRSRRDRTQPR